MVDILNIPRHQFSRTLVAESLPVYPDKYVNLTNLTRRYIEQNRLDPYEADLLRTEESLNRFFELYRYTVSELKKISKLVNGTKIDHIFQILKTNTYSGITAGVFSKDPIPVNVYKELKLINPRYLLIKLDRTPYDKNLNDSKINALIQKYYDTWPIVNGIKSEKYLEEETFRSFLEIYGSERVYEIINDMYITDIFNMIDYVHIGFAYLGYYINNPKNIRDELNSLVETYHPNNTTQALRIMILLILIRTRSAPINYVNRKDIIHIPIEDVMRYRISEQMADKIEKYEVLNNFENIILKYTAYLHESVLRRLVQIYYSVCPNLVEWYSRDEILSFFLWGFSNISDDLESAYERYNLYSQLTEEQQTILSRFYNVDTIRSASRKEYNPFEDYIINPLLGGDISEWARSIGMIIPYNVDVETYYYNNIMDYQSVYNRKDIKYIDTGRVLNVTESDLEKFTDYEIFQYVVGAEIPYHSRQELISKCVNLYNGGNSYFFFTYYRDCKNKTLYSDPDVDIKNPQEFVIAYGSAFDYECFSLDELTSGITINDQNEYYLRRLLPSGEIGTFDINIIIESLYPFLEYYSKMINDKYPLYRDDLNRLIDNISRIYSLIISIPREERDLVNRFKIELLDFEKNNLKYALHTMIDIGWIMRRWGGNGCKLPYSISDTMIPTNQLAIDVVYKDRNIENNEDTEVYIKEQIEIELTAQYGPEFGDTFLFTRIIDGIDKIYSYIRSNPRDIQSVLRFTPLTRDYDVGYRYIIPTNARNNNDVSYQLEGFLERFFYDLSTIQVINNRIDVPIGYKIYRVVNGTECVRMASTLFIATGVYYLKLFFHESVDIDLKRLKKIT